MQPISLKNSEEIFLGPIFENKPNSNDRIIITPTFKKVEKLFPFDKLGDMHIVNFIFSFLNHRELNSIRLLSKNFKKFADSPELYSPYHVKLKTAFIAHNDKQIEIMNKNNEIKTEETELKNAKTILATQRTQIMNQLVEHNDSWFGYFVTLITFAPGCFSSITDFFSSIFPSIKEKIKIRNGLLDQVNVLSIQIRGLENFNSGEQTALRNQLVTERNNLTEEAYKLNRQISDIKLNQKILLEKEATILEKETTIEEFIAPLFGGKSQYEALPLLTLNEARNKGGYIDFVRPQDMSAPIMRGIDKFQRNFFTIRFGDEDGSNLKCETFFEADSKYNSWTSASSSGRSGASNGWFIGFSSYMIDRGKLSNKDIYEELKAGIKNMQHEKHFIQ